MEIAANVRVRLSEVLKANLGIEKKTPHHCGAQGGCR